MGIARERVLTKASLSAQDCLFMGKHCFNSGALARSLEWFEEAWVMAGSERNQSSLRQDQVQQFLDHAAKAHDVRVLNGERGPELFYVDALNNQPANKKGKKSINQPPKRVEFSDPLNDVRGLLDGHRIFNQQREKPKI